MTPVWCGVLLLAGCGRVAFDPRSDANGGDANALYAGAFAYWRLDEGGGSIAIDSTGNGHTMNLFNGPSWTGGYLSGGVQTAGVSDYLHAPDLDLSGTAALTIAAWVRRDYNADNDHTLFELTEDFNSSPTGFGLFPDDTGTCAAIGEIQVALSGDAGYVAACYAQPTSGTWHHIAAVYDKSRVGAEEVALYIDGVVQVAVSTPFANDNTNTFALEPLFVMSRGGVAEFNASEVDEIVLFARALSPAEIVALQ